MTRGVPSTTTFEKAAVIPKMAGSAPRRAKGPKPSATPRKKMTAALPK